MADEIILFLSRFDENNSKIDTAEYTCPNGMTVTGRQTNEAPVKYLLSVHPDIREILCIVTQDAAVQGWDYFRTRLAASFPSVMPVAIPFEEGESFQVGPMSRIMERMQEGDSVWLESTGGL